MGGRKDICGGRRGTSFEAKKWLSLDACGSIGITLSCFIHIFSFFLITGYLVAGSLLSTAVYMLLYVPSFVLALASLFMAWTTDPGSVPMGARPLVTVKRASSETLNGDDNNNPTDDNSSNGGGNRNKGSKRKNRSLRRCHKCNDNFKPSRAHHDSVTGRCIVKFDHFCPWVGNAVGAMNHKFFVLFVGYTMLSCFFSLCLIGLRMRYCGSLPPLWSLVGVNEAKETEHVEECASWNKSYAGLILLVVSVVFFIFTLCMFVEQIEAIRTNASKIARMKMSVGLGGTELQRVTEEFNEMFGGNTNRIAWHWFLPLPVEFPPNMKKAVLGYDYDPCFDAVPYQEQQHRSDVEACTVATTKIELTKVGVENENILSSNDNILSVPPNTDENRNLVRRNSREYVQDPLKSEEGTFV